MLRVHVAKVDGRGSASLHGIPVDTGTTTCIALGVRCLFTEQPI